MKLLIIAVIISLSCFMAQGEMYSDRYDTLNLDEVINNERLFNAYIKCVLEEGKCTAEGRELKYHITDALQTGCSKCTRRQRQGARKVIKHLIDNEQDSWQQLVEMYDPKRVYTHKYEKELKSIKSQKNQGF